MKVHIPSGICPYAYLMEGPPRDQGSQENLQSTGEEEHCTGEEEAPEVHQCTWKHHCTLGEGLPIALN